MIGIGATIRVRVRVRHNVWVMIRLRTGWWKGRGISKAPVPKAKHDICVDKIYNCNH